MGDPYGLQEDLRHLISSRTTTHLNTTHLLPEPPLSLCVNHGLMSAPPPPPPLPPNNNTYDYDPIMVGDVFFTHFTHYHHDYYSSSSSLNPKASNYTTTPIVAAATASDHAAATTTTTTAPIFCSIENSTCTTTSEKGWVGFDPGNNRWPRQETLSLLEIRSRLDSKFRQNNQKAPLWNEIARIMAEEFGYQRSGKKCKEKFENLYKYYKKTREGKASRQDGKHYRFFRQLEAICGDQATIHNASTSDHKTHHDNAGNPACIQTPNLAINKDNGDFTNNLKFTERLSFSNSSDQLETSSSENNDEDLSVIAYMMNNKSRDHKHKGLDQRQSHRRVRKSWRAKLEEIVSSHMRKIIKTQDAWMERMLSVVEQREQEMACKEEERKRKESMRFDQEVHELWAKERAWVEARDAALIKVVKKHIGKELEAFPLDHEAMVVEEPQDKNKRHTHYNSEYHCEAVDHSSS